MKNCLYVGSFNPPTTIHLKITKDLLDLKVIDYLYFLPVNSKVKAKELVSIESRINMLNLIKIKNQEVLNIYTFNNLGFFNYLILENIKKAYQINYLLMGSDLFLKLDTFLEYENILKNYYLIVIQRDKNNLEAIISLKYSFYKNKIIIIKKEYSGSSTKSREGLASGKSLYLDDKVLDYIKKNNLYN